jgi:hypothetical protein
VGRTGPSEAKLPVRVEAWDRTYRDIVSVFVMSITAVLTAWCGFESSKWGGEMSIAFSEASSARIQAAVAEGEMRSAIQLDLSIYSLWLTSVSDDRPEAADYVEDRFTPHFAVAFEAWQADGMVENSPFGREEYVPPGTSKAEELSARADQRFADALVNNQRGDNYTLLTVLFALVLFLTAMSQRELKPWISRTFLGLSVVSFLVGISVVATFPIKI